MTLSHCGTLGFVLPLAQLAFSHERTREASRIFFCSSCILISRVLQISIACSWLLLGHFDMMAANVSVAGFLASHGSLEVFQSSAFLSSHPLPSFRREFPLPVCYRSALGCSAGGAFTPFG